MTTLQSENKAGFTPGPWKVTTWNKTGFLLSTKRGHRIMTLHSFGKSSAKHYANVHLIAQTTAMYEMLSKVYDALASRELDDLLNKEASIKELLQKAGGVK